ncbi:MAG: hypothetical protein K8W52_24560 [Deltaproteobacteria bacterium]|nr:hypothetical protein [Deltaproteobacteria bacterium]
MRHAAAWLIAVGTLIALEGAALAGPWYYEWSCSGACAPGQLAISGREGPFASRADCEYARDHDSRENDFVAPGSLGGLDFCAEDTTAVPAPVMSSASSSSTPAPKAHRSELELGVAFGPGWSATSEGGAVTRGSMTVGLEADTHYGRDAGGGSVQLGLYRTQLEAPMLGTEARSFYILPISIGLALTPKIAGGASWSLHPDLGASVGGFFQFGCSGCAGAVFSETLTFGYTLKAGVDLYFARDTGVSLDVLMPRWQVGNPSAGNLMLESPSWMLRLSLINRPDL